MNEEVKVKKNKKRIEISEIKKFVLDNKKTFIVSGVALLLVIIVIVGSVVLFGKGSSMSNKEDELNKRLKELGKEFYEVQYYPNLVNSKTGKLMSDDEKKEYAEKFKDTGIKIDLDSLARIYGSEKDKILEEFKNEDKACNYNNTRIIIWPKAPYEISSYEIETILDCGFDNNK